VTNLDDGIKHLAFRINGQFHMVHCVDSLIGMYFVVTQKGFDQAITFVKAQCTNTTTCDLLVTKLEQKFSDHELMNAFGIIYPQY